MSSSKKLIQASAGVGGGDFYPYTIDNSVRFASSSDKLTRTNSGSGSTKGCFSMWVKRSKLNATQPQLIGTGFGEFYFTDSTMGGGGYYPDAIGYYEYFSSSYQGEGTSSINSSSAYSVFRDVSAWYHVFLVWDTTLATATDRYQIWINNQRVTLTGKSNVAQNTLARWFYTGDIAIGNNSSGTKPSLCYLAEVVGVEGTAYAPTDFAEDKNGVWVPKNVSGLTFGTNGFYLDFSNSGALGTDVSGNGNNFTTSGLTSSDQMIDTPTNNFATMNPLAVTAGTEPTLAEGNLQSTTPVAGGGAAYSTMAIPEAGKWYFEMKATGNTGLLTASVGIVQYFPTQYDYIGSNTNGVSYYNYYGTKYVDGSSSAYGATWTTNDVIGVAVDADADTVTFYKNNVSQGSISHATSGLFPACSDFSGGYGTTFLCNFGQTSFAYTPPADHLALSTANLPEPTIGPNSDTLSDENFNTVLYTGTGSARTVTGVGFQPDWLWIKKRSAAENHALYDVLRGPTKRLESNNANTEDTESNGVSSFDSDGFSIQGASDRSNTSGATYVAWNWKANGSGVSNTDGDITSTVSANQDAGISIVTYTGNASYGQTVGHGLGVAPQVVICKNRSNTRNWRSYFETLGATKYINLDENTAAGTYGSWNNTAPTSSVFSTTDASSADRATNYSGDNFVAYCFAEVEGFSSFGSYAGNGSATDGPFIYTGFRPAYVMVKLSANQINPANWQIYDTARNTFNVIPTYLFADAAGAESNSASTYFNADILSNGFKIRGANTYGINQNGATYIYIAFAENPFKYSNAR